MSEAICIVLPSEGADLPALERSLLSLVTQNGHFRLHIHVQGFGPDAADITPFLAEWQARLGDPKTVLYCRDVWLSYCILPDTDFYTALREGMETVSEIPDKFIGWLRAGDVLLSGALAHVADLAHQFDAQHLSWIQGASGHLIGEKLTAGVLLRSPTTLIAQGLCDGLHWPTLLQGGMFFRAGLWHAAQAHLAFDGDTELTEWRLWQRFAGHVPLVQSTQVFGIFASSTKGVPLHRQIRTRRRMEQTLPLVARSEALRQILIKGPVLHHTIADEGDDAPLQIMVTDITKLAQDWAMSRGLWPHQVVCAAPLAPRCLTQGRSSAHQRLFTRPRESGTSSPADLRPYRMLLREVSKEAPLKALEWHRLKPLMIWGSPLRRTPLWQASRIRAWDQGWDAHTDTEWATLRAVQEMGQVPHGTHYVGFPWAGLIDAQADDNPSAQRTRRDFDTFLTALPYTPHSITTCQHPDLMAHLDLLKRAMVTDVFWPYATSSTIRQAADVGICMHVLPHYAPPLTQDTYQGIRRFRLFADAVTDTTICTSVFVLCPAGIQGNSPELWKVIAAGAIPVLPLPASVVGLPGAPELWRAAMVFWDSKHMTQEALVAHLAVLNRDIGAKELYRAALAQISLAFGSEGIGHGIHALMAQHADALLAQQALSAPDRISRRLRIYYLGPRAARTPLAYAPFARLGKHRIIRAETPVEADIVLTGWNRDLAENPELLAHGFDHNPGLRCMVISEEPLWDTVWSDGFEVRDRPFECGGQQHSYRHLNHMNTKIFEFAHLPYFLLTADHFIPRYISMLGRYAQMSPRALLQSWRSIVMAAAFVSEHRDDPAFDVMEPAHGVEGLSRYRTVVAEATRHPKIWRVGQGWPSTQIRRQELPDWHLDKLVQLQRQVRLCAAYENTHMRSYITEKLFDAFAVGAMPVCYAAPDHRVHELVAPAAMINTYNQPPETAASWVDWFIPEIANAESWLETAAALRWRLTQADALAAERQRVTDETVREINIFLQT